MARKEQRQGGRCVPQSRERLSASEDYKVRRALAVLSRALALALDLASCSAAAALSCLRVRWWCAIVGL